MDKLWAPWRINYVNAKTKPGGCIFCQAKKAQAKNHLIFKTKYWVCMLNIYPYNNGHLLIAPLRHVAQVEKLKDQEFLDLFKCYKRARVLLEKVLKPHGYNLGFNLGRAAGAGITGHLHLHVVPRWVGDTNFMPVCAGVKVISQSLEELSRALKNADK